MGKRKKKFNVIRLVLQWSILGMLVYMVGRMWLDQNYVADFEAYCPLGGLQAYGRFLTAGTLACSMTTVQIIMGMALVAAVIVFSKLFCGYICPLGTLTEWLGKLGKKLKIQLTIGSTLDRVLRIFKYALLFATFYFTLSSGELFCREYDPFYIGFSWFGHGVNLIYAIITLLITIVGSMVFKQFWCKYFCPLAGLSNIFTFIILFVGVFGIYLALLAIGLELIWVWPLAVVCAGAFVVEAIKMKGLVIPFFRISRNDTICTHCKLCDRACPQAITISEGPEKINHIDCNLCVDCVTVCPHEGALNINKKKMKWFPAVVTVVLVAAGLFLGTTMELPTVDERWGTEEQLARAEVLELEGLKDVKCFGSSMGFIGKMREVDGVLGAATYVGTKRITVLFDPNVTDRESVIKSIFSPLKYIFEKDHDWPNQLSVVKLGIERFFDSYDGYYLSTLLGQHEAVYGLETEYGEPVKATIYFDASKLTIEQLKEYIQSKTVTITQGENSFTSEISFAVSYMEDAVIIESLELPRGMFEPYATEYYDMDTKDTSNVVTYRLLMRDATNPDLLEWLPYLGSHLSAMDAIVSFETRYTDQPYAFVRFDTTEANPNDVFKHISADSLDIQYNNGESEVMENPFTFDREGEVLKFGKDSLVVE